LIGKNVEIRKLNRGINKRKGSKPKYYGKEKIDSYFHRKKIFKNHNHCFEEGSQYGGLLQTADLKSDGPDILFSGFTTALIANSTIFLLI